MTAWLTAIPYKTYLACFLSGLAIAFLVTPLVMRLARFLGAMDRPGQRKVHAEPKPLLGGLGIFLGMWLPLSFLPLLDNAVTARLAKDWWDLGSIFLAGLAMLLVGFLDDRRGLNARWKFAFQVPLAVALALSGISFSELNLPGLGALKLGDWGVFLAILWVVGITNALNLIDGIDGLATGVAFLVAATNAIMAVHHGNTLLAVVMCSMAGACLGFLRYNFSPAKVFLGDTGSLFLGITLAATAAGASAKSTLAASMLIPMLVLGYPAADTLLAMARRYLLGRSMFVADQSHIHHRLVAMGLCHRRAALVIYGICLIFCLTALGLVLRNRGMFFGGLVILAMLGSAGFWILGYHRSFSRHVIERDRPRYRWYYHFTEMQKAKVQLTERAEDVWPLLQQACRELDFPVLELECRAPSGVFHWTFRGEFSGPSDKLEKQPLDLGPAMSGAFCYAAAVNLDLLLERRMLFSELLISAAGKLRELQPLGPRNSSAPSRGREA